MRVRTLLALSAGILIVGLSEAGKPNEELAKECRKRLAGTWKVESVTLCGEELPARELPDTPFIITGNQIKQADVEFAMPGTFTLDPSKEPARIDFLADEQNEAAQAIYKLEGDRLTLCGRDRGPPPTEFKAPLGSDVSLFVLKRVKK